MTDRGWVFAEGGGMSGSSAWGEQAFAWMVEHARASAAPGAAPAAPSAVVIGAVPLDEPDDRLAALLKAGCRAAAGLVIPESGADHAASAPGIREARVVFIRGGDQGRYVKGWRGTPTEAAIRTVFQRGGVVAGTSAGCAILGEVTYSAEKSSLTPEEALADPFHEDMTLVRGFLAFVPGVLFDTHFTERARFARLPAMLARSRSLFDDARDVLGIGMDPRTAAACAPDGACSILGEGTATLMRLSPESRVEIAAGKPPTITAIRYDQLLRHTDLALPSGVISRRPPEVSPNAHPEVVDETAFEALALDGSNDADGAKGVLRIVRRGEGDVAAWSTTTGEGRVPACVIVTRAWERGVWERTASAQRCLAQHPGLVGLWLGEGCRADLDDAGVLRVRDGSTTSALVLDTRGVTHAGVLDDPRGRHRVHLEGATLHVLGPRWGFDLRRRAVVAPPDHTPAPTVP